MSRVLGRVEVRELSKRYGPMDVVDDVSFTVEPGMVTALLGPSGAGKSTTLRMLLGLTRPDAGTVTIGGRRLDELKDPGRTIGAALNADGFHPRRSGRNHLRVYARAAGLTRRRADEVLELTGLSPVADRPVGGWPAGQRRRLALATALLGDPRVLILDEPVADLGPNGVRLVRDLADEGRTVLLAARSLTAVEHLADVAIVLVAGRVAQQGDVADLHLDRPRQVRLRTPQAAELAALLAPYTVHRTGPQDLRVEGADAAFIGRLALRAGIEIHQLTTQTARLDDLFLELTTAR